MASIRIKIEVTKNDRRWSSIPSIQPRVLGAALALSLLLHVFSWLSALTVDMSTPPSGTAAIKMRPLSPDEKRIMDNAERDVAKAKKIIETQQKETSPPKNPTNLGAQDHIAQRETRVSDDKLSRTKALDPSSRPDNSSAAQTQPKSAIKNDGTKHAVVPRVIAAPGSLQMPHETKNPATPYEKLLPKKLKDIFNFTEQGFTEPLDKSIAEGDHVDMNTSNFRYLSYFTGLRKQIEMVWIYPADAVRRGLQGAVQLEMVIEKDGKVSKVRVIRSSGYPSLDNNMVKTIQLASPFAPLPKNWGKERLIVTGSFHYILSYASH